MVSTRRSCFNPENETLYSQQSSPHHVFQTLLSAIESPEGIKAPLLKSMYYLLINFSLNPLYYPGKKGADLNDMVIDIGQSGFSLAIKDTYRLSNVLFKELCKRFRQLFSGSKSGALEQASLGLDMRAADEELSLLLRCCMTFLNLLVWQQRLLLVDGLVLLMILRKLSLFNSIGGKEKNVIKFLQLISREYTYSDIDCEISFTEEFVAYFSFLEPSHPSVPILSTLLEVFADELLVHKQLREYLKVIDSICFTSEMIFMHHSSDDNIGIVIELMCSHISLSISDDQAFGDFLNRLSMPHRKDFNTPELSLTAAISLLRCPIMFSAPKLMQAHIISLVSEAIGSGLSSESPKPDSRYADCYLLSFERSVMLYTKHMSNEQIDSKTIEPSFASHIQSATKTKINKLVMKLDNKWHSQLHSTFSKTKSDLITSSMAYIKERGNIFDKSCRDEVLLILSCMIVRATSDADEIVLDTNGHTGLQDICLLASLLKLMSISLLQAVRCLGHSGNLGCGKALHNFSLCKEYDSIVAIISCFRKFNVSLPIQKSFRDIMGTQPEEHKGSNVMLLHFLGLLQLNIVSGFDFLVKGSLSIIMALMNLSVYEEGHLDEFWSLLDSRLGPSSDNLPLADVQKDVLDRKSRVVASKFQKIQTLYLSASKSTGMEDERHEISPSASVTSKMEHVDSIEEEMCSGEIFLKSFLEKPNSSEVDDLADFIQCKQGKDYSGWLKGRQKYRKWKCEKLEALRWRKKKKTWKLSKRNKN